MGRLLYKLAESFIHTDLMGEDVFGHFAAAWRHFMSCHYQHFCPAAFRQLQGFDELKEKLFTHKQKLTDKYSPPIQCKRDEVKRKTFASGGGAHSHLGFTRSETFGSFDWQNRSHNHKPAH